MSNGLLPSNSTPLEVALEEALSRFSDIPVDIRTLWNADTIPIALLPWLAWAYSVDEWDTAWSEQQKRQTVKTALEVQRIKGTIGAVKTALGALGIDIRVQEWFNQTPAGDPYTFQVHVETTQIPVTKETLFKALQVIDVAKNLRSHLSAVLISSSSVANVYAGAVAHIGHEIEITNYRKMSMVINSQALVIGD